MTEEREGGKPAISFNQRLWLFHFYSTHEPASQSTGIVALGNRIV